MEGSEEKMDEKTRKLRENMNKIIRQIRKK